MSDVLQEGAPAEPSVDPANLTGPGVTQVPDNAAEVHQLAAVAEENARLRAQLLDENERLKTLLADSQSATAFAHGLTDEDVRRLEHPEEFTAEYAAAGEHEALKAQFARLETLFNTAQGERANERAAVPQPGSASVTSDPLNDPSQTFTGTTSNSVTGPAAIVGSNDEPVQAASTESDPFASLTDEQLAAELARREQEPAAQ